MEDTTSTSSGDPLSRLLPLPLLSAESIPPSPNRTDPPATSIDWLPNFAGYAWVAYGASSLLVISHFPSPLSPEETRIGSIFRQILDIFTDNSSLVSAVSWSPAFPSRGDLAAASGNRIWVFSHDSTSPEGSSSWRQNAVLLQCLKVEAIKWTGAGDGIIAVGVEVVLWKSTDRCWEIAWKFKTDLPQTLVSAGWSVEGPIATASYPSTPQQEGFSDNEEAKCVIVCQSTRSSECVKSKLRHPLPVSSIEWRPFSRPSNRDVNHVQKHVLLTCCLDGTARLWSEVDGGKVKYFTKNINDHKSVKKCYYVVAVIELNQPLNGNLNVNPYMAWAMEIKGIFKTGEGASQLVPADGFEHNENGKCDWVIGFGPEQLIYFWAIHCLDDVSPLRFARVTLWKKKDLKELEGGHDLWNDFSNSSNRLFLHRVVISRNHLSGAPSFCSFIQLLPCNSLVWSLLYTQKTDMEHVSGCKFNFENFLSCTATGILNLKGHNGKILQVSVFPHSCEVELAVSLDSNGLLLFWLTSSVSRHIQGSPTLVSAWELCGKLVTQNSCSRYTCLCWTPSIIDEERILSIGHAGGIDCFLVRICLNGEENVECHYLCTVPFTGHGPFECGPNNIFSIPLSTACTEKACHSKFMLLGIWRESFQAISWEIILHSFDLPVNHFDSKENIGVGSSLRFESTFGSKQYAIIVIPCSSQLPDPHIHDQVASFDVVCPGNSSVRPQKKAITQEHCSEYPAYIMATGCSDGTLKLWRSNHGDSLTSHIPWELVGMFVAHQGALRALAVTDCGHKIATICIENHKSAVSAVHIWEFAHLGNTGTFLLADTLFIKSDITVLSWLTLGNGQLLLGLCSQNGFNVYAQRRNGGQTMLYSPQFSKTDIWICIGTAHTLPPIHDFLWGSRTTAVIVHDSYFCVVNPWLFLLDQMYHNKCLPCYFREKYLTRVGGPNKDVCSAIFSDRDNDVFKDLSFQKTSGKCVARHLVDNSMNNDHPCNDFYLSQYQIEFGSATQIDLISILDVVEMLGGSLPLYHPEALLMNIYSGKWKRAHVALRHLIEFLNSDCNSEKKFSSVKSSHTVPQILLSDYFEGLSSKSSTDKGLQWSDYDAATTSSSQLQTNLSQLTFNLKPSVANSASVSSFSNELKGFAEPIEKFYEFAGLTRVEKSQILAIVDLLCEVNNQHSASVYESLDEPGRSGKTLYIMNVKLLKSLPMLKMLEHSDDQRTTSFQEYMNIVIKYWTTLRIQQLQFLQQYGRSATLEDMVIDSGMIGWAYHSDCQENLLTSVLSDKPSWPEMQSLGVGFWFTDIASLRGRMEKLARSQYLKNKDPKDCALLYIALNRLQVLAGLFKISRDEKDKPLVGFLSRNFQEDKNKAAALKNAYVLMGRHQLELAIAFFLLGGDTFSAISVCAKNLGDEQLALVLCRLVEGRGGSQGKKLIKKVLLPSAIEKGNCLLASLLEWELGNYAQSFMNILGFTMKSARETSAFSTKHVAFLDPRIGIFCMMLATKNSMRNTVGEHYSAILCKWAALMIATSLNRCGLPLEALEYLSSSPCSLSAVDRESGLDGSHAEILRGILIISSNDSSNWLSAKSSVLLEYQAKLNLAVQYIYKLIKEHLSWPNVVAGSAGDKKCLVKFDYEKYDGLLGSFWHKLYTCISQFEHKFSLLPSLLVNMVQILVSLCNHGLPFIGNYIFHQFATQLQTEDRSFKVDSFLLCSLLNNPLDKAAKEISFSVSRYLTICCMNYIHDETKVKWPLWYHLQSLLQSLSSLRAILRIVSCAFVEDLMLKLLTVLDLVEYTLYSASFWFERNSKGLLLILQPLFITFTNLHTPFEVDMEDIKKLLPKIADYMAQNSMTNANKDRDIPAFVSLENKEHGDSILPVPKDESCFIIGLCFWLHLSRFMKHKLNMKFDESEGNEFDNLTCEIKKSRFENLEPDLQNNPNEQIRCVLLSITNFLKTTFTHVSSYHIKQLASLMQNKLDQGLDVGTVLWLEKSGQSQLRDHNQHFYGDIIDIDKMSNKDAYQALWNIIADPDIVLEGFAQEKVNLLHYFSHKPHRRWSDISKEAEELHNTDKTNSPKESSSNRDTISSSSVLFSKRRTLLSSWQKNTILKEVIPFEYPREVYKRNGELLEALCINSMDYRQAAVSSNKKGIVFFNWQDDGTTLGPMDYIWPEADWPPSGWDGSEPTSASTRVSPGVGHGIKNGAHVGIDAAGVSVRSRARPGRDLTGGGAFGIPGYAGIGAASLGWETQENFEEFVDPPTSVENISARALSSHPLMPFFLVGSSNGHIHLWEFGKDKASATYGVMPAENFPPPYSLASISSLQFDHWGHRFASAALDGTVCTWQLEVGGRSNVHPTESSLCFNGYASDVSYVPSSGSIIAVAGYSSTGDNVIIWDTLAPPMSSQTSIMCHEGGAISLSVFDNDIGSGSISPVVVTGGKSGDVGVHDFRYIATGKSKRNKQFDNSQHYLSSNHDTQMENDDKVGELNSKGMIWYIPKAHTGSVTKISTIPRTSLFLTGSKDGDVKLWDAKRARLMYHWPKLHERNIFLQPSSRGFGGVVRVAVTDIQVVSHGFLTCGGDGSVKLVEL